MKKNVNALFICLLITLFSSIIFTACEWKSEEEEIIGTDCDTSQVTLSGTVQPILETNCYRCHSAENAPVAGVGINLEEYESLKGFADRGSLLGSISHASGFSPMPKGASKLADCDIKKIEAWIEKGATND
ncbi:c-type cytochrome [Bernardetia sp.]|uniref:c-type cytochrome n=1 Tax=Bernardetia sp. TaxID=1937974 RepID=UPI0025BF66E5|nr:hypothetical protein [Bernardetia sp.]